MNEYRFAQLFVRLSRILGVLVLVFGLIYVGLRATGDLQRYSAAAYRASESFMMKHDSLDREIGRTLSYLDRKRFRGIPGELGLDPELKQASRVEEFEILLANLKETESAVLTLKEDLVEDFEETVGAIREKLLAHAQSQKGSSPSAGKRPRSSGTPSRGGGFEEHIFAPGKSTTFGDTREQYSFIREYLERLAGEASQPESKKQLTEAIATLDRLGRLFPSERGAGMMFDRGGKEGADGDEVRAVEEKVRAEEVAEVLGGALEIVRESVQEDWALDESWRECYLAAVAERDRCEDARQLRRSILQEGTVNGFYRLLGVVMLCFLILVISDFLETQLDIARNSFLRRDP